MDKRKASKEIAQRLEKMRTLFDACVKISDESGVGFELPWGGEGTDTKHMGAYYSPQGDPDAAWRRRDGLEDYHGWQSPAYTC